MDELKNYYRAFREYREKMAEDTVHNTLLKALVSDSTAQEGFQSQTNCCVWDDEWIAEMLDTIPYVERALAEQRKFIISHEEIRRIDQARKTSVESVRHLAQHSNMISKAEGEDIIPDRVLIVEREDNYFIYENRFLYTLVLRMHTFLEERRQAVVELNEAQVHSFSTRRSATWNRKHMEADIHLSFSQRPAKSRNDIDVDEMTSAERVLLLQHRVNDLMNAPLMRMLKGATQVSSPIVRTNVFKKNPNFKRALELFEFLDNYNKLGYEIICSVPETQKLGKEFQYELCEALALENFIGQINADLALKTALDENYQHENALMEQERLRKEEEREREVLKRITAARAEEIAIRETEIAKREAIIAQQEHCIQEKERELQDTIAHTRKLKVEYEENIVLMNKAHDEQIHELKNAHAVATEKLQREFSEKLERRESELKELKQNRSEQLAEQRQKLEDNYRKQLSQERLHAQRQLDRQEKKWKVRLDGQKVEFQRRIQKALARQQKESDMRLDAIKRQLEDANAHLKVFTASEINTHESFKIKFYQRFQK